MTLFKDKPAGDQSQSRVNIKKISSLSDLISKPYPKITIEVNDNLNLNELKKILGNRGSTEVNLIVNNQNKKIHYVLQNPRKLDYNLIKLIKTKEYVKSKIGIPELKTRAMGALDDIQLDGKAIMNDDAKSLEAVLKEAGIEKKVHMVRLLAIIEEIREDIKNYNAGTLVAWLIFLRSFLM